MALIFLLNLTCTHLYFFDIFHSVPFQPTLLYFVLSVLLPLFLNIGMHLAIFQHVGKIPLSKELFIIQVSGGVITSMALLIILVLIKSTPLEVFDFTFLIAFLTCSSVTNLNSKFRFLPFRFSLSFEMGSMS